MNFEIKWHPQAIKKLRRLPKRAVKRILLKLDDIALEPFKYTGHFEGLSV